MNRNILKVLAAAIALSPVALMNTAAQDTSAAAQPTGAVHEIHVTASKYKFDPGEIHVKKGETVKLILTATDHDHGIKLDEFHINQKIQKGTPATVEFVADKAGTFSFKCSVFCGIGHGGMKGKLIVEE